MKAIYADDRVAPTKTTDYVCWEILAPAMCPAGWVETPTACKGGTSSR